MHVFSLPKFACAGRHFASRRHLVNRIAEIWFDQLEIALTSIAKKIRLQASVQGARRLC
jgi:hypothetical protein